MTPVASKDPLQDESIKNAKLYNIQVNESKNVHLGSEIQYYGPIKVQQYVDGMPAELANRPDVGQGLAKAGLLAAASCSSATSHTGDATPSMTLLLPGSTKYQYKWWWVACAIMAIILLVLVVVLFVTITSDYGHVPEITTQSEDIYNPFPPHIDQDVTLSGKLRILDRREWLAQPRNHTKVISKAQYILITETGGDTCTFEARCKLQLSNSQRHDIQVLKLDDIAPNFLIGGEGYAYEGRNWDTANQCSRNETFDNNSICISFIGDFSKTAPSQKQIIACRQIVELALSLEKIFEDYTILGVKQVNSSFDSPGLKLYDMIQTCRPNWKSKSS